LRRAPATRRASRHPADPRAGRLAGSGPLAAPLERAGRGPPRRHPARLRRAGAAPARCRADARLLLSQAYLPARKRKRLCRAADRPGEDPPAAAGRARPDQGPGAAAAPCRCLGRGGAAPPAGRLPGRGWRYRALEPAPGRPSPAQGGALMQLAELQQAGRTPELPLTLQLNGEELVVERLLRVLPGQRYVGVARWQGRRVLAKLLVGGKAERHFQRELNGASLLAGQGLPTPQLLAQGLAAGQGGWLLFDYLDGAESLWDAWRAVEREPLLSDGQQAVLGEALGAIALLHGKGLWQADLHLDNLLRHDCRLYVIDGGGVQAETAGQPLSRQRVLENLGVFFAQLPAELDAFTEELLVHYLLANAEHALPLEALLGEVEKVRRWRLRDYLKKAARDCSLFAARIGAFGLRVVRREQEAELAPLLADIDVHIDGGHIYKTGGAATVARVELNGRPLVVKRYNIK